MGSEQKQNNRSKSFSIEKIEENKEKEDDNINIQVQNSNKSLNNSISNRQREKSVYQKPKKQIFECKINIYIYSNQIVDKSIKNFIDDFKSPLIKCNSKIIEEEFSREKSNNIISNFKENSQQNNNNVLIIPINSISDFQKIIESEEGKNILAHFNNSLLPEQQPFFLFLDYDGSQIDFIQKTYSIEKNFVLERYYQLKRLERDFEIVLDIIIKGNEADKIQIFKNILLEKRKHLDDFQLVINEIFIYQNLFGEETDKIESFLEMAFADTNPKNIFKISLVLINQNSDFMKELGEYEKLEREIKKVKFTYYYFNIDKLKQLLSNYTNLDQRNFAVKRTRKSQKYQLLKYTSYYNNLDNILFCNQMSYYPYKLNIGVWGFKQSGKSTLINAILNEKRCFESKENNNRNCFICKYNLKEIKKDSLKEYPISFIEFPGFDLKAENIDNYYKDYISNEALEMSNQNDKIHIFLFCIKYKDLLAEKIEYIKSIFEELKQFRANVFFVVTQSELPDSKNFKAFKDKIINLFNKIKDNDSKGLFNSIFGENFENRIIPICSLKIILNDLIIKPFGLDKLFGQISDLLNSKKIQYDIFLKTDEKDREIENLIKDNELLRIFNSKERLLKSLRIKMESTANNFIFKFFISKPDYLNNFSIEKVCNIYDYIFDHFLIIYKPIIDKLDEKSKLKLYNISNEERVNKEEFKNIIESKDFEEMKKGLIETKELINGPIIKSFSNKLSKLLIDKFLEIISEHFSDFFEYLIKTFNKSIFALNDLKQYFESIYLENNPGNPEKN